jgi:hypothetical protein
MMFHPREGHDLRLLRTSLSIMSKPIVNSSSGYGAIDIATIKMMGFTNIELFSDRPVDVNFREIYEVKKRYPRNFAIASLMVESKHESWHEMLLEQVPKSRAGSVRTPSKDWLGGLDSNQDNQIQNLMYCQLYDLPPD